MKSRNIINCIKDTFLSIILASCVLFSGSLLFPDKNYTFLKNLAVDYPKDKTEYVIEKIENYSFDNFDEWQNDSKTFDGKFSSYASLFRTSDSAIKMPEGSNSKYSNIVIGDVAVYDDVYFNFGNIVLLNKDSFKEIHSEKSIYISQLFADEIIEQKGLPKGNYDYLTDIKYPLLFGDTETEFNIKGVYSLLSYAGAKTFNKIYYDTFCNDNTTLVFMDRNSEYFGSEGNLYCIYPSYDFQKNFSIYDYVRIRFGNNITLPDSKTNSFLLKNNKTAFDTYNNFNSIISHPLRIVISIFLLAVAIIFLALFIRSYNNSFAIFSKNKREFKVLALVDSLSILLFQYLLVFLLSHFGAYLIIGGLALYIVYSKQCLILFLILIIFELLFFGSKWLLNAITSNLDKNSQLEKEQIMGNLSDEDIIKSKQQSHSYYLGDNMGVSIVFSQSIEKSDASGQRAYADATMLMKAGFKTFLFGHPTNKQTFESKDSSLEIKTINMPSRGFSKLVGIISTKPIKDAIKAVTKNNNKIDNIIIYSVLSIPRVAFLKRYCKKHNINLIFDIVEFQNLFQQNLLSFFTYYLPNMYINKCCVSKGTNVICISNYLFDYCKRKGANVVKIPFVNIESLGENTTPSSVDTQTITFLYAGSPGKKDNLKEMIQAFIELKKSQSKPFVFYIAGVSFEKILSYGFSKSDLLQASSYLVILGKLPFDEIVALYSSVDFTVLLKNSDARHAKADFPSKISQALAFGVPPIVNYSSDLEQFLVDGENSLIVENNNYLSLLHTLEKSLLIDDNDRIKMRKKALVTAKKYFSPEAYFEEFEKLIHRK